MQRHKANIFYLNALINNKSAEGPDLSPDGITDNDGNIVLKAEDWVTIQKYTGDGDKVPVDEAAMRKMLGIADSTQMPDAFNAAYPVFTNVYAHCHKWQTSTYPAMLAAANDIFHYADNANVYYLQGLMPLIDQIKAGDTSAVQDFKDVCNELAKTAQGYADKSIALGKEIQQFYTDTQKDGDALTTLKTTLDDAYGANSQEVQDMEKELADLTDKLKKVEATYQHLESAMKFTYLLGPVFGWIAHEVADLIKGQELEKEINAYKQKIADDNDILKRDLGFSGFLKAVDLQVGTLVDEVHAAIGVIQKISAMWSAMASDLQTIADYDANELQQNIDGGFITTLHVKAAAQKWATVKADIDKFRIVANVTYEPTANSRFVITH